MSPETRFVVDTNVLVSALLFEQSVPGQVVSQALNRGKLLLCRETVEEIHAVLSREKFDRYLAREDRELFLELLIIEAELIELTSEVRVCRDPKDDLLLTLAVDGNAGWLMTGDQDLLVLKNYHNTQIVSPAELLRWFEQK